MKRHQEFGWIIVVSLFSLGFLCSARGQTVLPLPFSNRPGSNYTDLRAWALSNQFTVYTSVSNSDAKIFRGVFIPAASTSKLAIHSDDGSTVTVDGSAVVNKKSVNTQLQDGNSFDAINYSFVAGQEYCIVIDYFNGMTNVNDRDGVTLYAYAGGGSVVDRPIIRGGRDALCVGQNLILWADCGAPNYAWTSSSTGLASVAFSGSGIFGTVTGLTSGPVTVTVTDTNNKSTSLALNIVKPGISPGFLTNCIGLSSTFVLTNSLGTGLVAWSQSGTLSANTRTNTLAFANTGTNLLTATYAGCTVAATVTVVAVSSLLPAMTNFCDSGTVTYTNQTTPAGFGQFVNWGGEGLTGTGASHTNTYGPGVHVVSNWCGTSVQSSTSTVYHIDIAQTGATLLAEASAPVAFNLTNSFGAPSWSFNPGGGPTVSGSGATVSVNAGSTAGLYALNACATAWPTCCDAATVQVVKVTFSTNLVGVCDNGTAQVSFTVQPTNFLGSVSFDTVTNTSTGPINTHATLAVSGTNLTITGVLAGTAYLRAKLGSSIYVGPTLKIAHITFPTNAWSVGVGYSTTFSNITIVPADAPVIYQSANPAIATATGNGTSVSVTGVSNGTTQVRAYCGASGPCVSKNVDVASVTMTPDQLDLCVTQMGTLTLTIVPPAAIVDVASEDPAIASVTRNGNLITVTAVASGSTSVRARINGSTVAISDVHCVRVTFATNDFYVAVNNVNCLTADVDPEYFACRIVFLSANPAIATVSGGPDWMAVTGITNGSTQIQAWFGTNQMCSVKTVNVVQPTVVSVEWVNLDGSAITNVNPNPGGGLRIFADRPTPTARSEDQVRIRARITPAVPFANSVFFQVYDVDDPYTNAPPIDNEGSATDNRGSFMQLPMTALSADSNGVAEAVFTVSPQPGDNFRAVAATDVNNFTGLAALQNDGLNARVVTNATGVPVPGNQVSPLLTVWRRLHVEVDSMAAVVSNTVVGNITGISGSATTATNLSLSVNLRTGLIPPDNSPNLSSGTNRGRFENGWVRIGTTAGQTSGIYGNGDAFLRHYSGFAISGEILSGGNTINAGQVIGLAGSVFTITGDLGAVSYVGNAFRAAGTGFTIVANTAHTVTVSGTAQIPFALHDDDDDTPLPHLPDTAQMADKFAPAYIVPIVDGGGNTSNNKQTVTFRANVDATAHPAINDQLSKPGAFESDGNRGDNYWIAYIQTAYQAQSAEDYDADGSHEWGPHGINGGGTSYRRGALFFPESLRDYGAQLGLNSAQLAILERRAVVHEIGHQFGINHSDPTHNVGINNYTSFYNLSIEPGFEGVLLEVIRGKITSPGK